MKISIQMVIVRNLGASILLLATAAAVALSAPQSSANPAPATGSQAAGAKNSLSTLLAATKQHQASTSSLASSSSPVAPRAAPASVHSAGPQGGASSSGEQSSAFEGGSNPFGDDSLWQIPIQLVRDSAATADDSMSKSASEMSAAEERDENDDSASLGLDEQRGATSILAHQKAAGYVAHSSPSIISASTSGAADLKTAAGYHHATPHHGGYHGAEHHDAAHYGGHHDGHYGKYFQYASVPYPYAWDFGYRRGNPYHTIERYEHGKGPHFQTKVKWSDKHGGYGVHVWDYNHDDHQGHHYGHDHAHDHYDSHAPSHHYGAAHGQHAAHYGVH